jgi:hypothetical protein
MPSPSVFAVMKPRPAAAEMKHAEGPRDSVAASKLEQPKLATKA